MGRLLRFKAGSSNNARASGFQAPTAPQTLTWGKFRHRFEEFFPRT